MASESDDGEGGGGAGSDNDDEDDDDDGEDHNEYENDGFVVDDEDENSDGEDMGKNLLFCCSCYGRCLWQLFIDLDRQERLSHTRAMTMLTLFSSSPTPSTEEREEAETIEAKGRRD